MRRGVAIVVLGLAALFLPSADAAENFDVIIQSLDYDPDFIAIGPGDTVTWTNTEEVEIQHTVTAEDGSFDSSPDCELPGDPTCLDPGDDFTPDDITSIPAGDYPYYCKIHGPDEMRGLLRVEAPPTTTVSTTTTTRPTTTSSTTTSSTTTSSTTTTLPTTTTLSSSTTEVAAEDDDGGGNGLTWFLVALIVVVIGGIIAVGTTIYRNREAPDFEGDVPPPRPGPPRT